MGLKQIIKYSYYLLSLTLLILSVAVFFYASKTFASLKTQMDALADDGNFESFTPQFWEQVSLKLKVLTGFTCVTALLGLILYKRLINILYNLTEEVIAFIKQGVKHHKKEFSLESSTHKLLFLLIIFIGLGLRIYYILTQPVLYDEAFTYIQYASRNIFIVLSNYSYPNNHIFHTLQVHLSTRLFGMHLWAIRLPALIAGTLVIPTTYFFTRKWFNSNTALGAMFLCAIFSELILYSSYARGYSLVTLLFLLNLFLIPSLLKNQTIGAWVLFITFSCLGFFTIPSFGYCYLVCIILLFINKVPIKKLSKTIVTTGIFSFLLYLPAITITGWEAVFKNDFVKQAENWNDHLRHLHFFVSTFSNDGIGYNLNLIVVLLLLSLLITTIVFGNKKQKQLFTISGPLLLLFIFLSFRTPPSRTFIIFLPLWLTFIAYSFYSIIQKLKKINWVASSFVFYIILGTLMLVNEFNMGLFKPDEFKNTQQVANLLSQSAQKNDLLLIPMPIDYTVEYYLQLNKSGLSALPPAKEYQNIWVTLFKEQPYTVYSLLKDKEIDTLHYSKPVLIKDFEFLTVYKLERE